MYLGRRHAESEVPEPGDIGEQDAPLLQLDLGVIRTSLGGDEPLQVADGVVGTALHADFQKTRQPTRSMEEHAAYLCAPDGR